MRSCFRAAPLLVSLLACTDGGHGRPDSIGLDEVGESDSDDESEGAMSDLDQLEGESEAEPDTSEAETDTGETGEEQPYLPALYPGDRVHSPITPYVIDSLLAIRELAPERPDDVFMKVGASSTVSMNTLYCFALDLVDLDVHEGELGPTLDYFLNGEAADTTPFDRVTLAAQVGKSAGWAISGSPSPVEQELAAIEPSLALIHYGANDMQMGATYASALPGYYENMSDLLDLMIAQGIVPAVFGLSRRLDQPGADDWVQTYNAVGRALAQARQIPFLDLRLALEDLPSYGLSGDGLHLEADPAGACLLDPIGLDHGYNVRNLIALELLDRLRATLIEGGDNLESEPVAWLAGAGTLDDPLLIERLPFADTRDTSESTSSELDLYSGCMYAADESGPEYVYRLELSEPKRVRALVLDRDGVDIDIHLLDASASEAGCLQRDDFLLATTLEPGVYYFALDTFVGDVEQVGEYTFVLLECEPGDPDCD